MTIHAKPLALQLLGAVMSLALACSGSGGGKASSPAARAPHAVHDAGAKSDAGARSDAGAMHDAASSALAVELKTLAQVGAVVKDASAASANMTQMLGIGPWTTIDKTGTTADGAAFSARFSYAYVGDLELELIEVTGGETPQTEFLRDHGEGLYDLGFFVDDVDAAVGRLKDRGATILLSEPGKWAYIDSPDAGGIVIKLTKNRDKLSIDATGFAPPADTLRPSVLAHVGGWTTDLKATTFRWDTMFGIGSWTYSHFKTTTVKGDLLEADLAFSSDFGATQFELVQPTEGTTIPEGTMRGDGRGLAEVAIAVDDPDAEAARLADRGAHIIAQVLGSPSVVDIGAGGVAFELVKPGP